MSWYSGASLQGPIVFKILNISVANSLLRHDLEQLNAGLSWSCTVSILAWPCDSRAYAGDGTATRKPSCYSPLRSQEPNHTVKRGVQQLLASLEA
jgi:hypothetical protein